MTDLEILAKFGLFFISALGFAFITGMFGLFLSIGNEDSMTPA